MAGGGGSPQARIFYLVTYELLRTLIYCVPLPQALDPQAMYDQHRREIFLGAPDPVKKVFHTSILLALRMKP